MAFLNRTEVLERLQVSEAEFDRAIELGLVPKPRPYGLGNINDPATQWLFDWTYVERSQLYKAVQRRFLNQVARGTGR